MNRAKWMTIVLGIALSFAFGQEKSGELYKAGVEYYRAGDYPNAIEAFMEIIKKSVDYEELKRAYIYLGYTYFSLPDEKNARMQIEHAIQLDLDYTPKVEEGFSAEFIALHKVTKESLVGIAFFDSVPSPATVLIDGKEIGKTPQKKELLIKVYEAKFMRPGYESCMETVEIKKGEIVSVNASMRDARNWKTFLRSALGMVLFSYLLKYI